MSVKGIFKALIGTVFLIVVSSLIIEIINVTISSLELTQISRIACRQAAVLFSQETYKPRDGNTGTVGMPDVQTADNTSYVDGQFYVGGSPEGIYKGLYGKGSDFDTWVSKSPANKSDSFESYWLNIKRIHDGLIDDSEPTMPSNVTGPGGEAALLEYTEKLISKSYVDVLMTPLNMGVPYLDEDTLNRMFRWNLAQMVSDCQQSRIRKDDNATHNRGKYYVYYNGFRVFAQEASITNTIYNVYELDNSHDENEFIKVTHINHPENLGFTYGGGYEEYIGSAEDERSNVCIVAIEFKVPISYEGITPLRRLAEFTWNYDVKGYAASGEADDPGFTEGVHSWSDATVDLQLGGFNGNSQNDGLRAGVLPVPGKLIYYVVR